MPIVANGYCCQLLRAPNDVLILKFFYLQRIFKSYRIINKIISEKNIYEIIQIDLWCNDVRHFLLDHYFRF